MLSPLIPMILKVALYDVPAVVALIWQVFL
jgi:hypothetical protein